MLRRIVAMALAWAAAAAPCAANDTMASLNAGGLVFEKSAAIQMKSEVLSISTSVVEVDYVFANPTAADATSTIAFPLPELLLPMMSHSPASVPFRGQPNYLGFHTWVDGSEVRMSSDVHALLDDGRDVAKELQSLGVNLFTEQQKWTPEVQAALLKLGAIVDGGYGDIFPVWRAKASYYWTQTFPAGKELHIKHRYSPAPLMRLVREAEPDWCTDDGYKAAFGKLPKYETNYLWGRAVPYVLSTGANWSGPIGDFTLKLDKGKAVLVSTCPIAGLSLKRQGNAFVAHAENYTPQADLNILFVFAGPK